jgi:L-fuconolactonase
MVEEMDELQDTSILKSYTDHAINSFGVDRVMYGSNWPVCLIKKSYTEVLDIAKNISTNLNSEKIFYINGKNFYLD